MKRSANEPGAAAARTTWPPSAHTRVEIEKKTSGGGGGARGGSGGGSSGAGGLGGSGGGSCGGRPGGGGAAGKCVQKSQLAHRQDRQDDRWHDAAHPILVVPPSVWQSRPWTGWRAAGGIATVRSAIGRQP